MASSLNSFTSEADCSIRLQELYQGALTTQNTLAFRFNRNFEFEECLQENAELKSKLDHLTGIMVVMKEDLQIKDEQFDFLYSSIRARTEQSAQLREFDERSLRTRVEYLESLLLQRDEERERLLLKLSDCNRRLILVTHSAASTCWLNSLPDEISRRCISYLDDKSVSIVSCVNKHFYTCASEDLLWMQRFRDRWGKSRSVRVKKDDSSRCWKQLYGFCHTIDENWHRQKARIFECKAHTGTVTCLALCGNRLVSGSDDGSMASWELGPSPLSRSRSSTRLGSLDRDGSAYSEHVMPPPSLPLAQLVGQGQWNGRRARRSAGAGAELGPPLQQQDCCKLRTFHGHGGPVWCLEYDPANELLVSGSYDRTVKVWDASSGSCVRTLRGHTGWVSSLALLRGRQLVVSSSWDCTVKLWACSGGDGSALRTMTAGLGNALYCVGVGADGAMVAAGCRHAQVQRWDVETGTPLDSLQGHGKEVHCLQLCERLVFSGSGDSTVKMWDASSGRCVHTLREHSATVMTLQYDNEYRLVTGSYDKSVKVWDIRHASTCVTTIAAHQSAVFSVKFDDHRLVTGGADHILKVFDFAKHSYL